jgi:hypothetical protein
MESKESVNGRSGDWIRGAANAALWGAFPGGYSWWGALRVSRKARLGGAKVSLMAAFADMKFRGGRNALHLPKNRE